MRVMLRRKYRSPVLLTSQLSLARDSMPYTFSIIGDEDSLKSSTFRKKPTTKSRGQSNQKTGAFPVRERSKPFETWPITRCRFSDGKRENARD